MEKDRAIAAKATQGVAPDRESDLHERASDGDGLIVDLLESLILTPSNPQGQRLQELSLLIRDLDASLTEAEHRSESAELKAKLYDSSSRAQFKRAEKAETERDAALSALKAADEMARNLDVAYGIHDTSLTSAVNRQQAANNSLVAYRAARSAMGTGE